MHIKGVNLGNWLVLEKWMSPALFEGTGAQDEYYLPRWLSREVYEARIRIHRSEYITERDFAAIRAMGMEAVRIPVPYFIFGDREPFIGCVEELDRAFCWAERYGLKILIDLHTAPEGRTALTTEVYAACADGQRIRQRWNLSWEFWNGWQSGTAKERGCGE